MDHLDDILRGDEAIYGDFERADTALVEHLSGCKTRGVDPNDDPRTGPLIDAMRQAADDAKKRAGLACHGIAREN